MVEDWFEAAGKGHTEIILSLIRKGADVNAKDEHGRTALMRAVQGRQIETIQVLLDHGADVSAEDCHTWTAMTDAVIHSQAWAVVQPDARPLNVLKAAGGRFGLREAVLSGDVELARQLCDCDDRINVSGDARFWFHDTFLMVAARWGHVDMVRFLLDRGADIEGTDDLGATALMRAADAGHAEIVRMLLDRGANVDHDDWSDQTPLSEAATAGHLEIVELLIARGAGRCLLDAVALDDVPLVEELLRKGTDPNHLYYGQGRLVMFAVGRGSPEIVRLLLDYGAAHYHENFDEHTLLAEAARHGRVGLVRLLIDRGADPNEVGRDGLTSLAWATKEGHAPVVDYLKQVGVTQ
jgi:ankyrin repeat protein